jgi:hypothetical protein
MSPFPLKLLSDKHSPIESAYAIVGHMTPTHTAEAAPNCREDDHIYGWPVSGYPRSVPSTRQMVAFCSIRPIWCSDRMCQGQHPWRISVATGPWHCWQIRASGSAQRFLSTHAATGEAANIAAAPSSQNASAIHRVRANWEP